MSEYTCNISFAKKKDLTVVGLKNSAKESSRVKATSTWISLNISNITEVFSVFPGKFTRVVLLITP